MKAARNVKAEDRITAILPRSVRKRDLQPTELINPRSMVSRCHRCCAKVSTTSLTCRLFADVCTGMDPQQRAPEGRLPAKCRSGLIPACSSGISAVMPYFRVLRIPDAPGKCFYVWLDAPIGYVGSFKTCGDAAISILTLSSGRKFGADLYHFIGKDIVYLPQPVLACHAGRQRLPETDQPVCPRL